MQSILASKTYNSSDSSLTIEIPISLLLPETSPLNLLPYISPVPRLVANLILPSLSLPQKTKL